MNNVLRFFNKLTGEKSRIEETAPKVKSIRIELVDGTVLEAFRPVLYASSIEDDIHVEEVWTERKDFGAAQDGVRTLVKTIPRRVRMTMKVEFRLYVDDKGMFLWATRPPEKTPLRDRIAKAMRGKKKEETLDDFDWAGDEDV